MPCAFNLTRREVHYRHEAFSAGLRAAGFEVRTTEPVAGKPGDLLLVWNLIGARVELARRFAHGGGTVVVAENGYLGRDADDHQLFALARNAHNGAGQWNVGADDRFAPLGADLKPWRATGDKIVIRGQRGIGAPGMASPHDWHNSIAAKLRTLTKRPIQVVPHPGTGAERDLSHERYLIGAHALVIWSSAVGVKALALGVPVFHCSPQWICEGAAMRDIHELESPNMDDAARLEAMRRMAWAQWRLAEIQSGEAFRTLLA